MIAKCYIILVILSLTFVHSFDFNKLSIAQNKALKSLCSSIALASTCSYIGFAVLSSPAPASAAIAPLADVGVGKYLVKDGRQLLRLSLPVGKFDRRNIF